MIILALPHTLASLQQGNFQVTATPLAIAGFALLAAGRIPAGAALVAYAALGKIFPGILIVYLVAARRWRALGWIAGSGVVLLALTLIVQGPRPMMDFVTHALPQISSGEAFPHSERPPTVPSNWSVYGATSRLRLLGVTSLTQPVGLAIASAYGVLVIALAAFAGWRSRFDLTRQADRLRFLQLSIALVGLASFRSPFVGIVYGGVSTFWLLSLLAAGAPTRRAAASGILLLTAFALAINGIPSPGNPPTTTWLWISLVLVLGTIAVNLWAVIRPASASTSARTSRSDDAHDVTTAGHAESPIIAAG